MPWTWTGDAHNGRWDDPSNWSNSGTDFGYPTLEGDGTVNISGSPTIDLNSFQSINQLNIAPGSNPTLTNGTLYVNLLNPSAGATLKLGHGTMVGSTGGFSMVGAGTATISGGTFNSGNTATINAGQTLALTGDTGFTVGNVAGSGTLLLNDASATLTDGGFAGTITFLASGHGGNSQNTLTVPNYDNVSQGNGITQIANLGYGDRIYAGGDQLELKANGDGTYSLIDTHYGQYTTTLSGDVTLAPGTVLADFVNHGGYFSYNGSAPCFLAGTMIATPQGEVAVETLKVGDLVLNAAGAARPVQWIGHRVLSGPFVTSGRVPQPIRFTAGSLGRGLPRRDLLVSPDHCMVLKGHLVRAESLVNGATIRRESGHAEIPYFHVELATHDVILAEGAPAETFRDDNSRILFQNDRAEVAALPPTEPCLPLLEEGQALAELRAGLEYAAVQTVWLPEEGSVRIAVIPGMVALRLRSPAARMGGDSRLLGAAISEILRDGAPVDLAGPALTAGWHGAETGWRWTDGAGLVLTEGAAFIELTVVSIAREQRDAA